MKYRYYLLESSNIYELGMFENIFSNYFVVSKNGQKIGDGPCIFLFDIKAQIVDVYYKHTLNNIIENLGEKYPDIYPKVYNINNFDHLITKLGVRKSPNYIPKKIVKTYESFNENVLYAFDLDDTLVYSQRFEDVIRPLLNENVTPKSILMSKLKELNIDISELKYENGRIYFNDPQKIYDISNNSSWVRKGSRIYIVQPESYYLTDESIPISVNNIMIDLYNNVENKSIITVRKEKLRDQTELALMELGVELPNYGLFMYPRSSVSMKSMWKCDVLKELYINNKFTHINYYDNDIKLLKKMKVLLKEYDYITLYRVLEDKYYKI